MWWASPACEALSAAVDGLVSAGVPVADAELGGDLVRLRREITRIEALLCERAAAFDARGLCGVDGAVSAVSWMRWACSMAPGAARGRVRVGRALVEMPKMAAAFADGTVGYEHVRLLVDRLGSEAYEDYRASEDEWVVAARETTPAAFGRIIDVFLSDRAGDGGEGRDRRLRGARRLAVSRSFEGMVFLDGLLDPEAGEVVLSALEAIMAAHRDVEDEPGRTPTQRRADALVDICAHVLDDGALSRPGRERPHVSAIVDILSVNPTLAGNLLPGGDDLCECGRPRDTHPGHHEHGDHAQPGDDDYRDLGHGDEHRGEEPVERDDEHVGPGGGVGWWGQGSGDISGGCAQVASGPVGELDGILRSVRPARLYGASRYCELDSGEAICVETARRILCDCGIVRILTAGTSEPIDVGRKTRVISPALRRALEFRDRHCQYPGCTRPASWSDAHHMHSWIDGGPTSLANLVLLCRRHHTLVHEGGYKIHRDTDGLITLTRPDGTHAPRPPNTRAA